MCNRLRHEQSLVQLRVPQGMRTLTFCCPATMGIMQDGASGPETHVWEGIPMHMHSVLEVRECRAVDAVNLRWPLSAPIVLCTTDLCSCNNHVTV